MIKLIHDSGIPWCTLEAKQWDLYKLRVKDLAPAQFTQT